MKTYDEMGLEKLNKLSVKIGTAHTSGNFNAEYYLKKEYTETQEFVGMLKEMDLRIKQAKVQKRWGEVNELESARDNIIDRLGRICYKI